ncbi:MAG: Ig-like domain-containing protein [Christensenellales bacterium]
MKQHGRASLRRCLAVLFAALMVFSVLPLTAMAEGIEGLSDNTAKAAVGGAEALAIGGEERPNATTVYYKPVTSIDTSKQYLITATYSGTVYAMTSEYYSSSSNLQAASLTADGNGYIQASDNTAIDNTYLWTFSTTSGGKVTNVSTGTQLYFYISSITLMSSGDTLVYSGGNLYYSGSSSYYLRYYSSYSYFTATSYSSSASTITLYERVEEDVAAAAESVEVNPSVHAMAPNATKQLTATVYPTDAANKNVTWTSDNNAVATVDAAGIVTAKTVGKATITATTADGGYTDTCVVTVTNNATKEVTMFVNTLHAVPNEDYLIGYTTTSGETYIMSNAVSNTSYLAAAEATLSTVDDVCGVADTTSCITALSDGSEIPTTHQWYFGADADLYYTTIQNRATNYYLQRAAGSNADTYVDLSTAQNETTNGTQSWARGTRSEGDVTFICHINSQGTAYHFVTFNTTNGDFRTYYNTTGTGYTVDLYVKRTVTVVDSSATPTPTPAPGDEYKYVVADQLEDGGEYIIVAADTYAVSNNTVGSYGHYLSPVSVTISGDECVVDSSVNVNEILWQAEGNTTDGFTLKSLDDDKYMTLDSSEFLYPGSGTEAIKWKYDGTDLANSADSNGYYYLSYSDASTSYPQRFTTSKNTGNSIKIYRKVNVQASTEPNLTIEPAELTVLLGGSGTLTATAANIPESATDISYAWTSDSESVATVASVVGNPSTATVTPVATGKATITCTVTYNEGGAQQTLTATAVVNVVENYQVASITVPFAIRLELDKGTVITPVVVTAPEGGVYGTDYTIEYVCDNESVADIAANGEVFTVTAKSTGTVTVTFTAINSHDSTQRVSGSTVITVKKADLIPAPEIGEGGGEKPIYKKVYVLVDNVEEADGNYIIATSSSEGTAYALYDNGSSSYVQRGSVTIQSGSTDIYGAYGKYIEPSSDAYVWEWRYDSTNSTYGRRGTVWNVGTGRGLRNNSGSATMDPEYASYVYSIPLTSGGNRIMNRSSNSSYYLYYSSGYTWSTSYAGTFYFYKEMIVQTGTESVDSGVEIYLDGEKISQKEKAIEGVVQGQESSVTLTGTPVNIPAGATNKSAVWTLTKTDGAIKSVDSSSGVVTLAGSLGYGIIEVTYTYTYGGTTYTVKNYTKLVVSSFKPMTGTGETVTKRTIYKLVTSLTDGKNYIIVNGSSAAGTRQALKPGGDNSTLFSGTYTPPNGGTASPYTAYIVGDGEVVVNAADSVSSVRYIETDDMHVVWRYDADDASTSNYGYFTNVGTARKLTFDNELEGYTSYYMLTADDTFSNAWYYSNNKIYMPNNSYYAGIYTTKVSGGGYRLYTSATSTSSSSLQSFYIFEETEIETVSTAEVSVDIYDGSKLVSGGVVSVNDTSSTLPLTAQTNYNGTGQIAWSIISGENIASIDQNGVVTFAANTSGKVLVQVTFTFGDGQTATNYVTLDVRSGGQLTDTSDRDNFPEYPNEGSVRLEKTADADETEFAKTGVGTVELFVRGVPVQSKGVDVVLVVDTSGSMEYDLTGAAATSGNDKMSIAKAAAINFANTLLTVTNPDGTISYTDNRLAVVSFASDAAVLTGTSPLVADSRALVSVNSSSDMSSITTAINSMSANGGTNYDAAFKTAYDILRDAQEQGGDRKQYVVFVTDGAPGIYNNAKLDSTTFPKAGDYYTTTEIETMSAQWYNWTQGVAPVWSSMPTAAANNFAEYAYADNIYAAAIKGTTFAGSNFKDSWKTNLDITAMLGAGIYGISLGMKGGSQIIGLKTDSSGTTGWTAFTSAQCTNLINRLCNKDIFAADSTEELTAAFEKIGKEVLQAGTNATVRDTIGADYDLQIKPFNYIDTANPRETDFESSIEVRKYTVDANGNRTGAYETIEKVTFNAAGTEAYSTLKTGNIMTWDGENYTITAENFTYTSSDKRFVWKFDTIVSDDMAIRFNVYLTGTKEGSREGGLYDTNSWANLTYTNYLGTDCRLAFEKPALPWQNARVTYKFFLVDVNGNPVNKDGTRVNYANLTYVGTEKTIKLGDAAFTAMSGADGRYSVELNAATLKALQSELSAYALYDESAAVTIHTDTTGAWGGYSITKGNTPDTTAVWPKPGAKESFADVADAAGNNFTNITVAFAVVFNVKLIPDAVVIDFGLPVDINVMQNDLVSQVSGRLYGLTLNTEAAPDFESAYTVSVAKVTTVGEKLSGLKYGHATIQNETTVRYTPGSMQMSQPEVFGYEVSGTSDVNGVMTTKYIRSTVTVIPATTIYYEDNFSNTDGTSYITYNNGVSRWELVGQGVSGTVVQDTDYVGSGNNYGYDSHYDNCTTFSLNQAHKVTVTRENYESILADSTKTWPTASFRFTGTGFDVISLTNADTGMIMVQVKDTNGTIVRSVFVDTYYSAVEVSGDLYQIPVINIYDLPHGTYDVTITVPYLEMFDHTGSNGQPRGSYDMYIDGIRIYNPADGNEAAHGAHTEDDEAYPYVQELRNMMLAAAGDGPLSGPVFVDGNADTLQASEYASNGPNNEVYLVGGQAIVFALQTVGKTKPAGVYVSMKSPTGEVKVRYGSADETVSESTGLKYEERNMVTTSDMYYEIPENVLSWEKQPDGTWKTKVAVEIANISKREQRQILALTNLKVTYASEPENGGEVRFTTTQQQSQVAYTQIRDLMAELYADSYDTEIRSAAFATRTIDVNKTTELNVVTSTDANALIIRDKKGNVITPESISYEDKDGERHWKLTMTHKVSGIYIYKVSVEAAYGIMTDTPATVVAYVVPGSVVRPRPSMPKPPLFGWM